MICWEGWEMPKMMRKVKKKARTCLEMQWRMTFVPDLLDEDEYEALSEGERQVAEASMRKRDREERRVLKVLKIWKIPRVSPLGNGWRLEVPERKYTTDSGTFLGPTLIKKELICTKRK